MLPVGNAPVADLDWYRRVRLVSKAAVGCQVNDQISCPAVRAALLRHAALQSADLEGAAALDREQKLARLLRVRSDHLVDLCIRSYVLVGRRAAQLRNCLLQRSVDVLHRAQPRDTLIRSRQQSDLQRRQIASRRWRQRVQQRLRFGNIRPGGSIRAASASTAGCHARGQSRWHQRAQRFAHRIGKIRRRRLRHHIGLHQHRVVAHWLHAKCR